MEVGLRRNRPIQIVIVTGIVVAAFVLSANLWQILNKNVLMIQAVRTLASTAPSVRSNGVDPTTEGLNRLLRLRPEDATLWRVAGLVHDSQGRPDAALEAWTRDSASANLLLNRGALAEYQEDSASALKWYGYASELTPAMAEPWYRLATVHAAQDDFADAETYLNKALQHEADNRDYWFALGRVLAEQGREEAALQAFEQAAVAQEGRVGRSVLFYQVGHLLERRQDPEAIEQAERAYLEAIRLDDFAVVPNWQSLTHYRLGEILFAREQYSEALEHYDNALSINSELYEARLGRGKTQIELALVAEAERTLQDLIQSSPDRAAAYWQLARLYEAQGDEASAQELRSQAAALTAK